MVRTKAIRSDGGVLVRITEAINGFRTKHGYWPSQIEISDGTLAALVTYHLTPFGFFLLQSKVELVRSEEDALIAKGDNGRAVFDYGSEGWQSVEGHQHNARAWIGISDEDGV